MTNSNYLAKKVELTNSDGFPRRFTVANGTAISKGILLTLSEPRTAAKCTTAKNAQAPAAGIAAMDKEANDGATSITAWTDGVFEIAASGAISTGDPVIFLVDNYVAKAPLHASGAVVIGYAMEDAATDEVINVRLRL